MGGMFLTPQNGTLILFSRSFKLATEGNWILDIPRIGVLLRPSLARLVTLVKGAKCLELGALSHLLTFAV